ncbi:MAG: nitrile hydratase subunit beta [Burkholderiaceae bacterium]
MNSIHDLGGMHGFGPVLREEGEPVFHAPWEGRVLAISRAMIYSRAWNLDMFRHAQERLPATTYLKVSYYHRWMLGIRNAALERGLLSQAELEAGHALADGPAPERALTAETVGGLFAMPRFDRQAPREPRFAVGDAVRTVNHHPAGHTRLPRFARGRGGVIEAVRGCHVFPDAAAAGTGDDPQWLYSVTFEGREIWGPDADPTLSVSIDAFEPYLLPA